MQSFKKEFVVTLIIYLTSGKSKKIDWEAQLSSEGDFEQEQAEFYLSKQLTEWMDKQETVIKRNVKGEYSVICFKNVEYAVFSIEEQRFDRSIEHHPAYR